MCYSLQLHTNSKIKGMAVQKQRRLQTLVNLTKSSWANSVRLVTPSPVWLGQPNQTALKSGWPTQLD
jgi:hypothetical protein